MLSPIAYLLLCSHFAWVASLELKTQPLNIYRPRDPLAIHHARRSSLTLRQCETVEWDELVIPAPDIHDKDTLGQLARMAANAYALPDRNNWYELDPSWTTVRVTYLFKSTPYIMRF